MRGFVQRWRKRRIYGKGYDESTHIYVGQNEGRNYGDKAYAQESDYGHETIKRQSIETSPNYRNIELQVESVPTRKVLRKFNDTYKSVYDEVCKKTRDIGIVKEQLRTKKGQNSSVERLFAELEEKQDELYDVYSDSQESILYSADEGEVRLAYETLKRSIQMVKYTQNDLLQLMKKVYQ